MKTLYYALTFAGELALVFLIFVVSVGALFIGAPL